MGVLEALAQEAEVGGAVLAGREGFAAIDAPLGDMAGRAGHYTAAATWHMLKECGSRMGSEQSSSGLGRPG